MKYLFCEFDEECPEEEDCITCIHFQNAEEDFEQIRNSHVVYPVSDE